MTAEAGTEIAEFERETRVRDLFAARLQEVRPEERLLETESAFPGSRRRADMRTVDRANLLRIYEVKLVAGYCGLGQVQVYLGMARKQFHFQREVRGVIAAFRFEPEFVETIRLLNLGIETVTLPRSSLAPAGSRS